MKKRRIFAASLAAVLATSTSIVAVAQASSPAAAPTEVDTFTKLTDAVKTDGANIKLTANITLDSALTIDKNVTIDLNGKNIEVTAKTHAITVNAGKTLTIKDSNTGTKGVIKRENLTGAKNAYMINVKGTLNFESGNLLNKHADCLTVVNVPNGGTLNVKGGKLESTTGSTLIKIDEGTAANAGKFVMTDGEIVSTSDGTHNAVVVIPGNSIAGETGKSYAGVVLTQSNAEIKGGKVTGVVWASYWNNGSAEFVQPCIKISGDAEVEGWLEVGTDFTDIQKINDQPPKIEVSENAKLDVSVVWVSATEKFKDQPDVGKVDITTAGEVKLGDFVAPEGAETAPGIGVTVASTTPVVLKNTENVPKVITKALEGNKKVTDADGNTVEVAADGTVTTKYTVTIANDITNGTVEVDNEKAAEGDKVTLDVTADDGYEIEKVTFKKGDAAAEEIEAVDGEYAFEMPDGDVTVSATFKKETPPASEAHKVTISTTIKNGTVTPDKTEAKKDDKVTLTVKANDGYEIEKVTFKSGDTEKEIEAVDGKYPFVMPDGDVTVSATFKEKKAENNDTYKITDTSTDKTNGNLAVDKVNAKKGDKVTLTVKAKEGYELDKLTVTDADKNEIKYTKNDDGTYSFTMPAGDVNFNATFKKTAGTNPVGPTDGDNNGGNGSDNKNTGIALAVAPVVLAGACAVVLAKKKR